MAGNLNFIAQKSNDITYLDSTLMDNLCRVWSFRAKDQGVTLFKISESNITCVCVFWMVLLFGI